MSDRLELYLLRHADAGDPAAWRGPDADRPLSSKGEKQSERLGSFLAETGFRPDALITSPKLRAAQTADIVGKRLGIVMRVDERLGSGFGIGAAEATVREAGDPQRVVLIGHDPDFSNLLAELCDCPGVSLKKGALARIDVSRPLAAGDGELRWLIPPDLLKGS